MDKGKQVTEVHRTRAEQLTDALLDSDEIALIEKLQQQKQAQGSTCKES